MRLHRWLTNDLSPGQRLAACIGLIVAVWLGVLPYIGQFRNVRAYINRNERLGIDPSAKFYTELPAMTLLWERAKSAGRRDAQAFWRFGGERNDLNRLYRGTAFHSAKRDGKAPEFVHNSIRVAR